MRLHGACLVGHNVPFDRRMLANEFDQDTVEHRIAAFRSSPHTARIEPGMQVVFTGDHHTYERQRLEAFARELGLVPHGNVTKSTSILLATDDRSRSGKAAKAHRYGSRS